ncbi:MAG TPA: HepT-like ribonuclease domain-containing protein [Puia sp.]|nr:HepT-like ribonuclease domain-containing protein [Puia sp.]
MSLSQIDFLRHIQDECIYLIKESQQCTFEEFLADNRLTRAVCRSLEIIGEAHDIVWDTIKTNIPQLKESIEMVIEREKM